MAINLNIDPEQVVAVLAGQTEPLSTSDIALKLPSGTCPDPGSLRPVLDRLQRQGRLVSGTAYGADDLVPSYWDGRQRYWATVEVAEAFRRRRADLEVAEHAARMTVAELVAAWSDLGGPAQPADLGPRTFYPRGDADAGVGDAVEVELVLSDEQLVWLVERLRMAVR